MTFDSCARRASGSKKKRREETPTRRLRRRLLLRTIDARDGGGRLLGGIKLHESVPSRPPVTTGGKLHASNPGGVGEEVAKLLFGGAPRDVSDVQSRRRRVRRFVFGGHACLSFVGSRVCLCRHRAPSLRFASLRFASGRVDVARAADAVWESLVIRYIGGLCRFVCSERVYSGSIILVYVEMYVEMYAQLVVGWMRVSTSSIRVSSTYTYARMHVSSTYTYVYPS